MARSRLALQKGRDKIRLVSGEKDYGHQTHNPLLVEPFCRSGAGPREGRTCSGHHVSKWQGWDWSPV